MERREFLQSFALATLAVSGASGTAQAASEVRLTPAAMDAYLRQLDKHMSWMSAEPMEGFYNLLDRTAQLQVATAAKPRFDALLRKVLRSMYLTRSFRELPEHGRVHPGMQQRIFAALPEMDAAVCEARDFLVGMSSADRLDLARTIRQNPELLPQLARHFDGRGHAIGLLEEGRESLSRNLLHLDKQLRRGDAGAVLDDYVARADRVMAQAGSIEDFTNKLRDIMGAPAFYSLQQRQAELSRSWWEQPPPTSYPGAGEVYRMGPEPLDEEVRASGQRLFVRGAIVLGIGIGLSITGAALAPFTVGIGAVPLTPGVPMIIAGAICMGIGSSRRNQQ